MDNHFEQISILMRQSLIGKHLPNHLYVHISALTSLEPLIQEYEKKARNIINNSNDFTLVKLNLKEEKISYLTYYDFEDDPHPILSRSLIVNLCETSTKIIDYSESHNPPILHRKETFVHPDYPHYEKFAYLTEVEEKLGLLDNPRYIGTQKEWQQLLSDHFLHFQDHLLACNLLDNPQEIVDIERHRAAITRNKLSRPVRLALEADLFSPQKSFFDYGCGHGADVKIMAENGYQSSGWDPHYSPDTPKNKADVVNLGYIINVIENMAERRDALIKAWSLTLDILIVSAQVLIDDRQRGYLVYGDGVITQRNTFQKYYEQEELKTYIEQVLNEEAIPIGLGVFLVFRNRDKANSFRASRFHSKMRSPRILTPVKKFADYEKILTPLMDFYRERGRLPVKGELAQEEAIRAEFRNLKQAFKTILQVTEESEWEKIADQRRQDILLYLALSRFETRPTIRQLPTLLKNDIKKLFGSYQAACFLADEMLISVGHLDIIKKICQEINMGKTFAKSFLIHLKMLNYLPTLLRLYEGCASRTIGRMESANLVRFYFTEPKISYLYVPDFDKEKNPSVNSIMTIALQDLRVQYRDFSLEDNAPIIKDKHLLLGDKY